MTIIVVASESIEVSMATQSLGGTNIPVAGIEVRGDRAVADAVGGDNFIDSG
jgi:hypothetical protein